ncbi:UNVERIFIED_CONTAM: hypothetical protein PYX00_002053 [Menopon gallinae]|uniref:Nucleolar complex protein 2 homolog n=1 Tax=Menopon gallinae TaxID=328185 RepID=A0AAW2IF37_9NEOP
MSSLKKTKKTLSKKTKSKATKPKKKLDLSKMSVDDFMSGGFENIDEESDSELDDGNSESVNKINGKVKTKKGKKTPEKKGKDSLLKKKKETKKVPVAKNEDEDSDPENSDEDIFETHKKGLKGLEKTDPEFYKYLKEHDEELLNFNESESDEEKEEEDAIHTAPDTLEVASDESDFEPEEGGIPLHKSERSITMAMVTSWQEKLPTTRNKKVIRDVVDAFHAAVLRVSTGDDQLFRFKVEGSAVFNAIIRMCVMDLNSGIRSFLKIQEGSRTPITQNKLWAKLKPFLKIYFEDLTELAGVTSTSMLTVLLKHIHQMIPYLMYFPNIAQRTLRRLVDLWSKSEDVVRVLSFLCLLRLTNRNHSFLSTTLKKMYLTYVKSTKFVSPNTLPEVNFMRQSLSEMFALDYTVTYQMAFVYIRQLAIHLRNAITLKKRENYQTVYNWQYISSLQLWSELLGLVPNGSPLRSLVYPLIQIIIGTIKLIPSSQYYPLRFHCCKILINMSSKCNVFIPVLPFLLEVLHDFDFNRKAQETMKENGFKDALIENINHLLIEYIATESHRLSFPDVFVPAVLQIKQFVKQCKVVNYTKMMKAILEKVNENSKFIESERKQLNFKLDNMEVVESIEAGIKAKGTPFMKYHENWMKVYMQQQARKVVDNVKIGDYKLPVIYKMDKKRSREQSRSAGPPVLFPSDDEESEASFGAEEDSDSDEELKKGKKKKKKMEKKTKEKPVTKKIKREPVDDDELYMDGDDIVQDLQFSDVE